MISTNTIINPKPCIYNCGTRIYWNTSENAYFEVFSGNRHQCPNRSSSINKKSLIHNSVVENKPNYYNNNRFTKQSKPKMSNSLELLQGPIADVQQRYEILSDIVSSEANCKIHGSQSHIIAGNNSISLIVYYEVPEGQRDEIKHKFNSFIKNLMVNYSHQQKYNDEKHL
jgi:hypothetical protein